MCNMESLKVDLGNLAADATSLRLGLDNAYFGALEGAEVSMGCVDVIVDIKKTADKSFHFAFHITGEVTVTCDRCLDDMQQPIATDSELVVKLGQESSEEDEVMVVDENEPVLDLSWIIYESIALAIPIKHVHAPGKCNRAMLEKLEEYSAAATRSSDEEGSKEIDPRWSKLADLNLNN